MVALVRLLDTRLKVHNFDLDTGEVSDTLDPSRWREPLSAAVRSALDGSLRSADWTNELLRELLGALWFGVVLTGCDGSNPLLGQLTEGRSLRDWWASLVDDAVAKGDLPALSPALQQQLDAGLINDVPCSCAITLFTYVYQCARQLNLLIESESDLTRPMRVLRRGP